MTGGAKPADQPRGLSVWVGFVLPPLAWLSLQQGAAALVYWHCSRGGPPWAPLAGALAFAVCAGAGLIAWRASHAAASPARIFIGRIAAGAAGIFALGCLVITAAMLIVPACAR